MSKSRHREIGLSKLVKGRTRIQTPRPPASGSAHTRSAAYPRGYVMHVTQTQKSIAAFAKSQLGLPK